MLEGPKITCVCGESGLWEGWRVGGRSKVLDGRRPERRHCAEWVVAARTHAWALLRTAYAWPTTAQRPTPPHGTTRADEPGPRIDEAEPYEPTGNPVHIV